VDSGLVTPFDVRRLRKSSVRETAHITTDMPADIEPNISTDMTTDYGGSRVAGMRSHVRYSSLVIFGCLSAVISAVFCRLTV
jgi:hypothetical protein